MRWPRFRVRIWMLPLLVVVSGIAFGGYQSYERAGRFRSLAALHSSLSRVLIGAARQLKEREPFICAVDRNGNPVSVFDQVERETALWKRQADYHAALSRQYSDAAQHPWLSVPPDPPEPE